MHAGMGVDAEDDIDSACETNAEVVRLASF
jgi:hypothetical protein